MDRRESAAELRASIDAEMALFRRDAEKSSQGEPQSVDAKRRRLSNEMVEDLADRWEKVIALMKDGGASAAVLDEARARSSEDIAWLMAERKRREAPAGDEGMRGLQQDFRGPVLSGAVMAHGAAEEPEQRGRFHETARRANRKSSLVRCSCRYATCPNCARKRLRSGSGNPAGLPANARRLRGSPS